MGDSEKRGRAIKIDNRKLRDLGNSYGITLDKRALEDLGVVEDGELADEFYPRVTIRDDGRIECEINLAD